MSSLLEASRWLISLPVQILIQIFIAYHVYFLSKRLSKTARLEHKEQIKQKTDELLSDIHRRKLDGDAYLVNINRYFRDYPSNQEKRFTGYSRIKAEIKATRFDGVEFFAAMPVGIYRKPSGQLSFSSQGNELLFTAFPVGVVPYEWIEHIDLEGDEYAYLPLFYCHFKARTNWKLWKRLLFFGYPYRRLDYYRESEVYEEGNDPVDMKYRRIYEPISKR